MKKILILFMLACFYNVYAVDGYNTGDYFMMCSKDGGSVIRDIFIENEKAFFLNHSSGYNYDFFYYNFVSNYEDSHSKYLNYLDVFKEFGITNEKKYLLRLIWDDYYGVGEKFFCSETEEDIYLNLKNKIEMIEKGPQFVNDEIHFFEDENVNFDDDLLKYYEITNNNSDLNINFEDSKLVISGLPGKYEIVLSKKLGFNEPAKMYQNGDNIAIKYGYGVSKKHALKIVIEKKEEIVEDIDNINQNIENAPVIDKIETNDKISFIPKDTGCLFKLKKLVLGIIRLIFG